MAPKRRKCPICGSKQWHKEPSSGLIACSEGHILQNYRNETTEIQEMGPHAMKKRTLKSQREKKVRESKRDPKLYHGARARTHYFLCLQLILRRQIEALTKEWDLPPEFETICKDLWTLYLISLPDPLPEPIHDHEGESKASGGTGAGAGSDPGPSADTDAGPRHGSEKNRTAVADGEGRGQHDESGGETESDSDSTQIGGSKKGKGKTIDDEQSEASDDEEEDDEEPDPELEALMRENSDFDSSESESESQSNDDDTEDDEEGKKYKKTKRRGKGVQHKKRRKGLPSSDSPLNTLAILVIGCWILRVPVLYMDFTTLISSYKLPYLSPLHFLPASLTQHLTKHRIQALTPGEAPDTLKLHKAASKQARLFCRMWGVVVPEWNFGAGGWRVVRGMGGGSVLYVLTKRVLSALSMPLRLDISLAPGLEKTRASDASKHQYDNAPPEVQVLVCILIVLKMVYGLDGVERRPRTEDDPACGLPDKEGYVGYLKRVMEEEKEKRGWDRTTMCSDEKEMDEYMHFCETVLVGNGSLDAVLDGYFPFEKGEDKEESVPEVQYERLIGMKAGEEGEEPGALYKIWTCSSGEFGEVVSIGSELLGVASSYVVSVLLSSERKLKESV